MIVSDRYRFVFVHIPKCAGTSVRRRIQHLDDSNGAYTARVECHPALGRIDYVHMPICVLRQWFPAEYRKLLDYRSFCIVRDPYARFPSSLAQRIREYRHVSIDRLGKRELRAEIENCMHYLAANRDKPFLPPEFIHFQPQADYIFDSDGSRLVREIYGINELDRLFCDLNAIVGTELDGFDKLVLKKNKTVVYRNSFTRRFSALMRPVFARVRQYVPAGIADRTRNLVYASPDRAGGSILKSREVRDFIDDFYGRDLSLCRTLENENQVIPE